MPGHFNNGEIIPSLLTKNSTQAERLYSRWKNVENMQISIGNFSSYPARNGLIFQRLIFFLEKWVWLLPLILICSKKYKEL